MGWTAIIPLKQAGARKTRLAARLAVADRDRIADQMVAHVAGVLAAHPEVADVLILSPDPPAADLGDWRRDTGRGLNAELTALRETLPGRDLLFVHADLPLLRADDIGALIAAAAANGIGIAGDRRMQGTNALALRRDVAFAFAFGVDSLASHGVGADGAPSLVQTVGLGLDVDTPHDLDDAIVLGFRPH